MKIIYLTSARLPNEKAHGYQIAKMCEAFAEEGIEIEIVAPRRSNPLSGDLSSFYHLRRPIKVTLLPCWDTPLIPWYFLRYWIMICTFAWSLKIFLKKNKDSQIYLREIFLGLFVKNFIMEIHMLPKHSRFYHHFLWRRAKSFVSLTSYGCRFMEKRGIKTTCLVAPDGVDLSEFDLSLDVRQLRQKLDLPIDKTIVLYTGSFYLYDWKGIDILLEASKFFDNFFLFLLIGGRSQDIKRIEKQYGLANVKLISQLPHSQISEYQMAADILVLPNKSGDRLSEECTSPLKLFEYMASGRPIIASNLPSIKEVLSDSNAILVEPNSAVFLADGIKELSQDKNKSTKLAKQALLDIQNYTWSKRAHLIYSKLIDVNK